MNARISRRTSAAFERKMWCAPGIRTTRAVGTPPLERFRLPPRQRVDLREVGPAPIPLRTVGALPNPTLRSVGKREDGERTHAARVSPTVRQDRGEGLRAGKRAPLAGRCLPVGLPRLTQLGLGSPVPVDARLPIPQRGEAPQVGCGRSRLSEPLDRHELSHRRAGAVVEGVRIRGIEVDEPRDPLRLRACDRAHLGARDGVSRQHRVVHTECDQNGQHVVAEPVGRIR